MSAAVSKKRLFPKGKAPPVVNPEAWFKAARTVGFRKGSAAEVICWLTELPNKSVRASRDSMLGL
jgi:hypothetical protein